MWKDLGGVSGDGFNLQEQGQHEVVICSVFFFSSRRRHTRFDCDWSSDVCSSEHRTGVEDVPALLLRRPGEEDLGLDEALLEELLDRLAEPRDVGLAARADHDASGKIGRASCRERVETSGVAESLTKKS